MTTNTVSAAATGLPFSDHAPSRAMLEAYCEWLEVERRILSSELYPELGSKARDIHPCNTGAQTYHFGADDRGLPSTRAALVLTAVGCDWEHHHDDAG